MQGILTNACLFLIKTLCDIYLLILMVRLILAYAQANYFNPIVRLIIIATQGLVEPLRRFIRNYRRIELSTLAILIIVEMIKIILISALTIGIPNVMLIFEWAILETIKLLLETFFYAILLQAIMSWFQTGDTPATQILQQLSAPVLRPLRRIIPTLGGIDITPIPALFLLQLILICLGGWSKI